MCRTCKFDKKEGNLPYQEISCIKPSFRSSGGLYLRRFNHESDFQVPSSFHRSRDQGTLRKPHGGAVVLFHGGGAADGCGRIQSG